MAVEHFVIYRPSDGTSYTAISNGDGTFHYQYALVSIGFTHVVVADFNGDGKADVFYYRSSDGLAFPGIRNGAAITMTIRTPTTMATIFSVRPTGSSGAARVAKRYVRWADDSTAASGEKYGVEA